MIERAELLLQQNRPTEAAQILGKLLETDASNPVIFGMLALAKLNLDRETEALELIGQAIALRPDDDHFFYIQGLILSNLTRLDESEKSVNQAISINPSQAEYYGLLGSVRLHRKKYQEALDLADLGLSMDSENLLCLNVRGQALLKLNRKEESFETLEGALHEDPNNAMTHANYGWSELEKGNHKKALDHFKEALKNDPELEFAQMGMIEALKARYLLYRWFLAYSFWMSNLTANYQWTVIIGFYVGFRVLRTVSNSNPELAPILQPILIVLMVVALSTWVTGAISNLFLRLNPFGNHLLERKEKMSSNLVGICLALLFIGLSGLLIVGTNIFLALMVFGFGMMIPCSTVFSSTNQKLLLPIYAIIMAIVGVLSLINTLDTGELYGTWSTIFIVGLIAYQWLANYVIIKESNV